MKEITLKIPDNKFDFFMELIKQLGIEVSQKIEIPEEHRTIVNKRIKKSNQNPERLSDWDQVPDNFRFD